MIEERLITLEQAVALLKQQVANLVVPVTVVADPPKKDDANAKR